MESTAAAAWGEWLLLFVRPDEPGFWLLVDLIAAVGFAVMLGGSARRRNLVRALRWLVTPFLALLFGAVSLEAMGLAGVDRGQALRLGMPLVVGILLLLALVRLAVRPDPLAPPRASGEPGEVPFAILYAGVEQAHWCFQRAAMLTIFMALPVALSQPAYWALWAAIFIALPGLLFVPSGWARLWSFIALATTAILFFYTRNFWLAWALHAGIFLLAGPSIVRSGTTAAGSAAGQSTLSSSA
jgi:hypothetical protein